jgi:16S rRNA (guanine527-N7)-methyltransferase
VTNIDLENSFNQYVVLNKHEKYIKNFDKTDLKSKFVEYAKCILKWGKIHNIISSKFNHEDVFEAIVDSVIGGSFLEIKNEIYDIGSGGGFPGIPMAIINPKVIFTLVESDRKKCSFLRTVKSELNLPNIVIDNSRIESLTNLPAIVSKAAFSPKNMSYLTRALAPGGTMALWTTPLSAQEYLIESKKHQVTLVGQFPYELSQEKKRLIMIFSPS